MSREAVYVALFSLIQKLKTAGTVKVCDRRVKLLDKLAAAELPALYLAASHGDVQAAEGQPGFRTLGADIYVYAANPDPHTPASTVLNGLIDAVEGVLAPDGHGGQTLGAWWPMPGSKDRSRSSKAPWVSGPPPSSPSRS